MGVDQQFTGMAYTYLIQKIDIGLFRTFFKITAKGRHAHAGGSRHIAEGNGFLEIIDGELLIDTQKSVLEISYESGFNTLANFNKQFLKLKQLTPSGFRKKFRIQEQEEYQPDEFRTLNEMKNEK